ncbi:MAG: hypothetical protein MSC31_18495 [Solirubrobacteraceae bacterium MAG38_C4-C5]|nr:hypothetical protein [Candidatus Siliceabacter maunaloa]
MRNHGFHGPLEGELAGRVWRDDETPLARMVERYASRPDADSPLMLDGRRRAERADAEGVVLAGAPAAARPAIRGILALGRQRLHLRGVAKRSMLQGFDGIRAAARRLADLRGLGDDVFYLTLDELRAGSQADPGVIRERQAQRAHYELLTLPVAFSGTPEPIRIADVAPAVVGTVEGIGVSGGVAEGIARVVTDPTFGDVEDGEVLIAPTTS